MKICNPDVINDLGRGQTLVEMIDIHCITTSEEVEHWYHIVQNTNVRLLRSRFLLLPNLLQMFDFSEAIELVYHFLPYTFFQPLAEKKW